MPNDLRTLRKPPHLLAQGLVDAQAIAGWRRGTTWPRIGVLRWVLRKRLDHALVSGNLRVIDSRVLGDWDRTTRPILARVGNEHATPSKSAQAKLGVYPRPVGAGRAIGDD